MRTFVFVLTFITLLNMQAADKWGKKIDRSVAIKEHTAHELKQEAEQSERLFKHIVFDKIDDAIEKPYAWNAYLDTHILKIIPCVSKLWHTLHKKYITNPRDAFIEKHKTGFIIQKHTLIFNPESDCFFVARNTYQNLPCIVWSSNNVLSTITAQNNTQLQKIKTVSSYPITLYDIHGIKKETSMFQVFDKNTYREILNVYCVIPMLNRYFQLQLNNDLIDQPYGEPYSLATLHCKKTLHQVIQAFFTLSKSSDFWYPYFNMNNLTMITEGLTHTVSLHKDNIFNDALAHIKELNALYRKLNQSCTACLNDSINTTCIDEYRKLRSILESEALENAFRQSILEVFARNHTWYETSCYHANARHDGIILVNAYDHMRYASDSVPNTTAAIEKEASLKEAVQNDHVEKEILEAKKRAFDYSKRWKMCNTMPYVEKIEEKGKEITLYNYTKNKSCRCITTIELDESLAESFTVQCNDNLIQVIAIHPSNDIVLIPWPSSGPEFHAKFKLYPCPTEDAFKRGINFFVKSILSKSLACYRVHIENQTIAHTCFMYAKTELPNIIAAVHRPKEINPFNLTT